MFYPTIASVCLGLVLYLAATPVQALSGCFCRKADASKSICGEVLKYDPDEVIRLRTYIGTLDLRPIEFTSCQASAPPAHASTPSDKISEGEHFGIAGSNTIGEKLMPMLIMSFAKRQGWRLVSGDACNGDFRLQGDKTLAIDCHAEGTHTGIPALAQGKVDIAMLSRPIADQEKEQMAENSYRKMDTAKHEAVIALDGLLILVSPRNPVRSLSIEQLAKVFAGEITDWRQLGGPAGKIVLHVRDGNSGTRDTFQALVMKSKAIAGLAHAHQSSTELSDAVAQDQRAIGFVGFAFRGGAKALAIAQECGLAHTASAFEIKTEDYPLSRRLFLYTAKEHSIHSHNLVDYAVSDEAQPVIESAGYINQAIAAWSNEATRSRISAYAAKPPAEAELEVDQKLLRQLGRDADHAERLSLDFRFRPGSAQLDTKAAQDVLRLAAWLKANAQNRTVLLLGFADAQGPFASNLRLSRERADEVRRALVEVGGVAPGVIVAKGYSELLPVACNRDELGREKNRRVEAWLTGF
jgi:phosphate transport system substrate-binding protein